MPCNCAKLVPLARKAGPTTDARLLQATVGTEGNMASTALVKVREQLARIRATHAKKARRLTGVGMDAVVIGGVELAAGFVQGRYGAVRVPKTNVPADLALAAAAYAVGVFEPVGIADSTAHQAFNFGHALLGSHLVAVGRGAGKKARAKAGKPALMEGAQDAELSSLLDGLAGARDGGGTLSDDDLVKLAQGL